MRLLLTLSLAVILAGISVAQPLNNLEQRREYLNSIYNTNRAVNYFEDSVMVASGFRSEEHMSAIDSLQKTEGLLAKKVDEYLNAYGYPEKKVYGEIANLTPLIILQQCPMADIRSGQMNRLYKAYKQEEIEESRFIGFLESEYKSRFQKNYQSYLQGEPRLKDLMAALEFKSGKL